MASGANEILEPLDAAERGFVLGALLLQPSGDGDSSSALEPPSDGRCRDALARIAALPRSARVKLTRQLAREVMSPVPAGIEEVEEGILAALLRDEPPDILRLVARTAPRSLRDAIAARITGEPPLAPTPLHPAQPTSAPDSAARPATPAPSSTHSSGDANVTRPVVAASLLEGHPGDDVPDGPSPELLLELQRALFSRIVPVHPTAPTSDPPAGTARELLRLDPARRMAELSRRGATVLGQSLQGARREVILRAAALAGAAWADRILAAAGISPDQPDAGGDSDMDRKAAVELVAATAPATAPGETVTRLGARAAGGRTTREGERGLAGADQARALAQRLPPALAAEVLSGAGLGPEIV